MMYGVDYKKGIERVLDDQELYLDLLTDFSTNHSTLSGQIYQAIKNKDKILSENLLHDLKGSSSNISAIAIYEIAVKCEYYIQNNDYESALLMTDLLNKAFEDLSSLIEYFKSTTFAMDPSTELSLKTKTHDHLLKKKQNILIVDDSLLNASILHKQLKFDFDVQITDNGKHALEIAFSATPPDLILLDVVMPELNGYEVCKKLKQTQLTKDIPVIFITEKHSDEDEIYGFSLGAVDYITKPFNPVIVNMRVKTHAELKRYRDYLKDISYLDGLTGIANRRRFDEQFSSMWHLAMRKQLPLSIMLIDIDHFKRFNDRYGHDEGDECLRVVAKRLSENILRNSDLIARYGGEEFVVLLVDTPIKGAIVVAEKIRESINLLKIPNEDSPVKPFLTVSIGIKVVIPHEQMNREEIFHQVDQNLYQAKNKGRNQIYFDSSPI